jgi:hypothetical protein
MTTLRALSIGILFAMGVLGLPAQTEPHLPYGGSYEITARLELPHLERWAVDKVTIVCLTGSRSGDELPIPVVSANNPFAKCTTANLTTDGSKLAYDIVCPGRGAARGHASYILSPNKFSGRVAMVMGAKNMTMTEVQQARQIGWCSPVALGSAASSRTIPAGPVQPSGASDEQRND